MQDYKQLLFTNERVLPYQTRDLNYPLSDKIIAEDVVGLPKITDDYLIYSNTKKEVVILSYKSAETCTISLPSNKKKIDISDLQLVVSDDRVLVYLQGKVYTISIHQKIIIDETSIFCAGLDTAGYLYRNQITYNPGINKFGLFDLATKESIWTATLSNYCVKTCGNDKTVIIQDGLFLIHAYDKNNGRECWTFDLKSQLNEDMKYFMGINSVMALQDNQLIFGCNDRLYCIDSQTGKSIWSKAFKGFSAANMSVYENGIISSVSATAYYEIETKTGNISSYLDINQITRDLNVSLFTKPILTANQVIVFSAMNSRLFIFYRRDFKLAYQSEVYNVKDNNRYQPAISSGLTPVLKNQSLFTLDMDGVFREYNS